MTVPFPARRARRLRSGLRSAADAVAEVQDLGAGFAAWRLSRLRGHPIHECLVRGVGPVVLRTGDTDAKVFLQVFRDRQYDLGEFGQHRWVDDAYRAILASGNTPLVVDLGANNGASALWFALAYPQAQVIAVEPDPGSAQLCRRNTAGRRVRVVEAAIGSTPGSVALIDPGDCSWGVSTQRSDAGAVPVVTVPQLVDEAGPDGVPFLVKVDIEGFEDDLFAENLGWIDQVTMLIVEPHDWLFPGRATSAHLQRVLAERGFELLISRENLIFVRQG